MVDADIVDAEVVAVECGRQTTQELGEVANASRIVSLNCRTLPNPAAKAASGERQRRRLDSNRAVCTRRAGATERAGTEFVGEHPVRWLRL